MARDWSGLSAKSLKKLNNKNINTDGIEIIENGKTFFWKGKYHNDLNSRDTLITDLNVLADFNPIVPEKYKNSEVVKCFIGTSKY